jgi:uncharacterized BrkB/YihY/UPF0761 family membrane protein
VFIVLMVYVYASSIVFLVGVQLDELIREDARADEHGILHITRDPAHPVRAQELVHPSRLVSLARVSRG